MQILDSHLEDITRTEDHVCVCLELSRAKGPAQLVITEDRRARTQ